MSFIARTYQKDAVRAVVDGYRDGKRQLLLRLPTGAGKTVISALIIEKLLWLIGGRKILFLAHRKEIIDQTAEKISHQIGAELVSIEQGERRAGAHARVVVASVQSLAGRLHDYSASEFSAVIVDECHHAYAKSWLDTIGYFGKEGDCLILGLTATPKRSDGRCVSELFKETAFEISLGELQEQGFLVPMDYFTVEASLGLSQVPRDQSGDFQVNLLGKIMNSPELRLLTLKAWAERARGRKTIVFCASVKHAVDLCKDFQEQGVRAAFVSGESQDRDKVIQEFKRGEIQVLSNFAVLTEGFDDPSIECVLLARPTSSPLVYSQCLGRGLRSFPSKTSCTVIDIVDRQSHQLQYNVYEAAGLHRNWRGSGRDPLREAEAIARIRVTDPEAFLRIRNALSLQETHKILMDLDPRTVLAGIDGMPLLRYSPRELDTQLNDEAALTLAAQLLAEAQLPAIDLMIDQGCIEARYFEDEKARLTPYLAWHLQEATGLLLAPSFQKRPVFEPAEPVIEEVLPIPLPPAKPASPPAEKPVKAPPPAISLRARLQAIKAEVDARSQKALN